MLPRLAKKADIEKRVHFHGLRHCFASELSKEGVPVEEIRCALGHSSLATTACYLNHIAPHDLVKRMRERPDWQTGA